MPLDLKNSSVSPCIDSPSAITWRKLSPQTISIWKRWVSESDFQRSRFIIRS